MTTEASKAGQALAAHRKTEIKICQGCGVEFTAQLRVTKCKQCKARERWERFKANHPKP